MFCRSLLLPTDLHLTPGVTVFSVISLIVKINRLNNVFILCGQMILFHTIPFFWIYRSCPCAGHLWGASMGWTCPPACWLLLAGFLLDNFPQLAPSKYQCVLVMQKDIHSLFSLRPTVLSICCPDCRVMPTRSMASKPKYNFCCFDLLKQPYIDTVANSVCQSCHSRSTCFLFLRPGADAITHTGQQWEDNVCIEVKRP